MKKLTVPDNICLRKELWPGFGPKEAAISGAITGIMTAVMFLYCRISQGDNSLIVAVFSVVLTLGCCIGLFSRVDGSQSIYEYIKRQAAYKKEQQTFSYKRREEVYCIVYKKREN